VTFLVDVTVGMDELSTTNLSIYPNPANEEVHVTFEQVAEFMNIELIDATGRVLNNQVSKQMGANLIVGGTRKEAFYEPTILVNVTTEMPVFNEETFGPVASIITFKTIEEAIQLSNQSEFGLGVSIFTQDIDLIKKKISAFSEGAIFINEMVRSDPRLPFGGIKKSGYGRELAEDGIKEFVNVKTVVINIL
jgi:succinate-semialdehyde dehydrogenase/glutarate-semialdehyde dehydrogenase